MKIVIISGFAIQPANIAYITSHGDRTTIAFNSERSLTVKGTLEEVTKQLNGDK